MENRLKTLSSLSDIPSDIEYSGYVWISNDPKPIVIIDNTYDFSKKFDKAYIIEAYLYSKEKNLSISVKHLDGKDLISQIDLNGLDISKENENISKHRYIADAAITNKYKEITDENKKVIYLDFIQYWDYEEDELCENLKVLKPTWVAFVGFETKGGNDAK